MNRKIHYKNSGNAIIVGVLLSILFSLKANAQIGLQFTDTTLCPGNDLQMCATISGNVGGLDQDDQFSAILNIGFNFVFFGNTYSQLQVSSNNFVTFDSKTPGETSWWTWATAGNDGQLDNSILMGFQDTQFGNGQPGEIRYQSFGTAPNRVFVLEFCEVPQYYSSGPCGENLVTNQLVLHETSNNIEINTFHLPQTTTCPTTTPGWAVQGVRNIGSAIQIYTPNRGPADFWGEVGADLVAVRYTPDGSNNYIIDSIPYNPVVIINANDTNSLTWYAEGNPNTPIANGPCANVVTNFNTHYYVVKYEGSSCSSSGSALSVTDTVHINFGITYDTLHAEICQGQTYNFAGRTVYAPGEYDTLFHNTMGCDSNITLYLTVNPLPDVEITSQDNSICAGDSLIIDHPNPSSFATYQWYENNTSIDGATNDNLVVGDAGEYTLVGITDKGCIDTSRKLTVTINPAADAEIIGISRENVCFDDTVTVTAKHSEGYQYHWSPEKYFRGDASYFYASANAKVLDWKQPVYLMVMNQFGCKDYDTATLTGHPCCDVYFPSAFSPNGDGLNDYFTPNLSDYQKLVSFQVFDRYGKEVYANNNPEKGWDGKYPDGKDAAQDTYMYIMQYTCTDGQNYTKKGDVTLVK